MKVERYLALLLILAFTLGSASAASLTLQVYTDDYGVLSIDGNVVGAYDGYPAGNIFSTLNLTDGWHNISIDYKNRYGTNALSLSQEYTGDPVFSIVPLADLRSLDAGGLTVSGLRGDYYGLDGSFLFTRFGEGPIQHGATSFTDEIYQSVPGLWAGVFGPSADFEERLSGEILVGSNPDQVPEPSGLLLAGTALAALLVRARRRLPVS